MHKPTVPSLAQMFRTCGQWATLLCIFAGFGCSEDPTPRDPPLPLPPLPEVVLSDVRSLVPSHEVIEPVTDRDPSVVDHRLRLLEDGFGDVEFRDGEPVIGLTLDGSPPPAVGGDAKLISRFVHLADAQLADDESPIRGAAYDVPGVGAFRPQEDYGCRILNAAARTIKRLHEDVPIDFVVLGGDNIDSAQDNELDWFLGVLSGAPSVKCDSAEPNDPIEGANNDGKDAFIAEGLDVPWLWVNGNHDILVQGLQPIDTFIERALGTFAPLGTRDWREPGGPVVVADVPADPKRRPLTALEVLERIAADGDGHGIGAEALAMEKATFTWDVPNSTLRMLVIDSATSRGGAEGVILQSEVDDVIRPALDRAVADGKLVILASHHSSNTLSDGSGPGGQEQEGALSEDAWRELVGSYPNVVAHLTGHSHIHRVHVRQAGTGVPYWEVITPALGDYPHQMRVIELWDHGSFVSLRLVSLDYATEGDPVAAEGRRLGVLDYTSGWWEESRGEAEDRNVELWVPKP